MNDFSVSVTLSEMRLIIEGAVSVYEEHGSPLASTSKKNEQYEAAAALETLGTALYALRKHICTLQRENVAGRLRQTDDV